MSEEKKENGSAPASKPAAPAAEVAPPPPVGEVGKALEGAKIPFAPLGEDAVGIEMIDVAPDALLRAGKFIRDNCGFDLLLSCSGVDWKTSLQSVYHFYNTQSHQYLAIKVTAVDERLPSLMPVWPAADWHERETYDLFGICYDGHPNLSRILMPSDWLGHPMRKDYKVDDPRLVWNER
ncbi:MAG TPA: NADH-quinone oxidoreductase subunit C [Coleofasciculaceae cyanobacterium]|jgi:NADH/F420H2 dehydrogenase subunit C